MTVIPQMLVVFVMAIQVIACSGASDYSSMTDTNPGTTTIDPLAALAFNTDVITPQPRFASYSQQAGRASIIDPDDKSETWGFQASGYDFAAPHPGFSGISLFTEQQIKIVTPDSEKYFSLNDKYGHLAIGGSGINYAMSSEDGSQIEVIRALGNGQWQQEVFNIPWPKDTQESGIENSASDALVSFFGNNGNTLHVLNPADGKYMQLNAASNNSVLQTDFSYCEGNSNTEVSAVFRTILFDESRQTIITGDGKGTLTQINLDSGCHDFSNTISLSLASQQPILNIKRISETELVVSQANHQLTIINYDEVSFNVKNSYDSSCTLPVGALPLNNESVLITCLPGNTNNFDKDRPYYQVFNLLTGETSLELLLNDKFSGVGVDINNMKLHRMLESSLGVLQTFDLNDGSVETSQGIFLNNILD